MIVASNQAEFYSVHSTITHIQNIRANDNKLHMRFAQLSSSQKRNLQLDCFSFSKVFFAFGFMSNKRLLNFNVNKNENET